jgi:hypothetical protein
MIRNDVYLQLGTRDHLVQFYGDREILAENVVQYLMAGAARGETLIVIATEEHTALFSERLGREGVDVRELERRERLVFRDARKTLSEFLVGDEPDWPRFDRTVGALVRRLNEKAGPAGLRAYGEMVDLLWKEGRLDAATKLEGFWNRLLQSGRFGLFCAYTVDLLSPDASPATIREMISTHSQFLPARNGDDLQNAVVRAMDDVFGSRSAEALRPLIRANVLSRVSVPEAERTILWLRNNLSSHVDRVLSRARAYCEDAVPEENQRGEI